MASGKLAVLELAQETYPPFKVAMNLDPHAALEEAREMVVSAGASLLLFSLREGREVRADAGPQRSPFPAEQPTPDGILAWSSGLQSGRPLDPEGASVEVRPSIKKPDTNRKSKPSALPEASEAEAVVLVSCHEFAGPGPCMSP
jgi:hypothetical protein